MKWNCPKCTFEWEGNMDNFDEVLNHEKNHKIETATTESNY